MEYQEKRRESIDEFGLNKRLIGVPNAVEETFPELFGVFVGKWLRLRRKP